MKRKWLIPLVAVVVAVGLAVAGYLVFVKPDSQPTTTSSDSSQEVGKDGGTFSFHDGIKIDVPEGAVEDGTTLSVGEVLPIDETGHAPFGGARTGAVSFDVSLSKGGNDDIQPNTPLDIIIPLEGDILPEGANPQSALLYTDNGNNGFWYMPPPLDENGMAVLEEGVLHGKLYHLSPKYVSYLDEEKFLEEFGLADGGIAEPEDCLEATDNAEFGPKEGWSNTDPASPINACLSPDGDGTHVGIVNRLNYILSVASTTDSEHLETSYGGIDEELVELFASTIFPNENIDAFFGRDGRMDATFAPGDLPATIQLKADPNTFLSEIGLFAVKFVANIFTGGTASEVVRTLLEVPDVISCLQTTFDISEGDVEGFDLLDAVNYVSSRCVEEIAKAVGYEAGFWDFLGRVFNVVAEGVAGGLQTITTAFEGIRMQFVGTLSIEVQPVVSYVGEWGLHTATMTVNEDGTGMFSFNDGPCGATAMCQGFSEFTWELTEDGTLLATIVDRWSESSDGTIYTPDSEDSGLYWSDTVGETFTLYDRDGDVSVMFQRNDVEDDPHIFCGPDAPDDPQMCGL
jgi:hypothetical protein